MEKQKSQVNYKAYLSKPALPKKLEREDSNLDEFKNEGMQKLL